MLSRATMQGHPQGGGGGYMRQHPGGPPGPSDSSRPSRLMQMREDYQRRLTKEKEELAVREKEEKMLNLYQDQQRRNEQRAERMARAPQPDDYPKSRLRQPGYMQQQQQQQQQQGSPSLGHAANNNHHSSVRNFFRERHEIEARGGSVPPINQHYQNYDRRGGPGGGGTWQRPGGGIGSEKQRVGSGGKHNAGVDRANPLAPIQARHGGISSAPTRPLPARSKPAPHLYKQTSFSPDMDSQGHVSAKKRPSAPPSALRGPSSSSNPPSGTSSRATTGRERMSDFQKWQLEQNRAREDRLKKLNMRAPPSEQSRDWAGDYEYEDEVQEEEEEEEEGDDEGVDEELKRKERELLERIANQQAELDRMRKQREREEAQEREEAEMLRKQQAAEKARRRRQQIEEERRRRQEEAQARKEEEEEQQRAARARQDRQRYEARLDLYDNDDDDNDHHRSMPNSHHEDDPFKTSSHRDHHHQHHFQQQPNSHRSNPFQQPNSHPGGDRESAASGYDRTDGYAAQKYTPKPPSEPPTPRGNAGGRVGTHPHAPPPHQAQRKASLPAEQYDELPAVPGPGADFYSQPMDGERGAKVKTAPCKVCGRRFAEDRLQKHQAACKNANKKRQAFDPTKMRTEGTDMAKYVSKGAHKKEHTTKKKGDWRRQHQEFINNIRYAKQMTQMEQQGVAARDLPPPPPSMANPDLVPCPHCGRSFNESAAERHIPRCQSLKTKPITNSRRRH